MSFKETLQLYHDSFFEKTGGVAIVVADNDRRVLFANQGANTFWGQEGKRLLGSVLDEFVAPEDQATVRELCRQSRVEGIAVEGEFRVPWGKDLQHCFSCNINPVVDSDGTTAAILMVAVDISERRKLEKALRLDELRLDAIVNMVRMKKAPLKEIVDFALEECVRVTSSKIGYLAFLNADETVMHMYAWSLGAMKECAVQCPVVGKPLDYRVAETGLWGDPVRERRSVITNDYQNSPRRKGQPEGHIKVERHLGSPLIVDGKIVLVVGVGNKADPYDDLDIRQLQLNMEWLWQFVKLKRAEDAAKERASNYEEVFNASYDPIFVHETETGIIQEVNSRFEELFGWKRKEIIGKTVEQVSAGVSPYSGVEALSWIRRASIEGPQVFDWLCRNKKGQTFWAEVSLRATNISGKGRVLAVVRDTTERRLFQERSSQLEKMEALGQLAGGVAHDFNNMLAGIIGFADLLQLRLSESKLKEYADEIIKTAERCKALNDQLLAFARKGQYLKVPVDLHALVTDVVSIISRTIDKRISITSSLGASDSFVVGDPAMLQSALLNLAINARDAMPNGGTLSIVTENVVYNDKLSVQDMEENMSGEFIKIELLDTGVGMDETVMSHLFEPFFTTKDRRGGTGLGLASVYGTVKSHKGSIQVKSNPNQGTVFSLCFPVAKSTSARKDENLWYHKGEKGEILVVDDELVVRSALSEMLTELGYHPVSCGSVKDSIELYRTRFKDIALVIIDMIMPEMSGRELYIVLKDINPSIKAILSSGYSLESAVQDVLVAGIQGFIQKPYRISELAKAVSVALENDNLEEIK